MWIYGLGCNNSPCHYLYWHLPFYDTLRLKWKDTACGHLLRDVIKILEVGLLELKWQLPKPECTGASHRWFWRYYFFPFVRVSVAVKVCHVQKCRVMVDVRSATAAQYFSGKCISVSDNRSHHLHYHSFLQLRRHRPFYFPFVYVSLPYFITNSAPDHWHHSERRW